MPWSLIVYSIIAGAAMVCYAILLVTTTRSGLRRPVERCFAAYLATMLLWSFGALMMFLDYDHAPVWNKVSMVGMAIMPLAFYGFVQAFRERTGRDSAILVGIAAAVLMLVLNLLGYLVYEVAVSADGMIGFELGPAMPVFITYYLSFLVMSAAVLVYDLHHTQDFVARNRIKYILLGLVVVAIGSLASLLGGAIPFDITASLINALIIGYAISEYNLLDFSLIVRKGLIYSQSAVLVAVGCLVAVFVGIDVLHLGGGALVGLVLLIAVGVTALLQPGHELAQVWVDRLFFPGQYDAGLMLQRVSRKMARLLDIEHLSRLIVGEICESMQVSDAALLIRDGKSGEYVTSGQFVEPAYPPSSTRLAGLRLPSDHPVVTWLAEHDQPLLMSDMSALEFTGGWADGRAELDNSRAELFLRLIVGHELVGILVLGPKGSETPYTAAELAALQTLCNQAAVVVQNAWLYTDALTEKARAQTILQAAFAGIVVVDQELRIVAMNPSAEDITGHRLSALQGRPLAELLGPDPLYEDQPLAEALASVSALTPTEITLNDGGQPRDVLLGMTPLHDGFLLNFADITRLKDVDRLKSEIVANVSHELRGPLASIKGYTELLLDDIDGNDPSARLRFLTVIEEETDRLAGFINNMLDLTRLEYGHVEVVPTSASMGDVVAEVVRSLGLTARSAGVKVEVEIPPDLPAIRLDRDLTQTAVKNLVGNAIKFSQRGASVEVRVRTEDAMVVVEVVDHGPGISAEDLPHLFTKFYRGRAARQRGIGGSGLGLVLTKQAVELQGGTVSVESEPGRGSTFFVRLPLEGDQGGIELRGSPAATSVSSRNDGGSQ